MPNAIKLILGSAAAIAIAGSVAFAAPVLHHMTIRSPDGATAEITYTGDVAPKVMLSPAPRFDAAFGPSFYAPFAQMNRIATQIDAMMRAADQQMTATLAELRREGAFDASANGVTLTSLPPGSQSYSFVSTFNGNDVCTRMVEISSDGDGAKPRVVSHSSGNCDTDNLQSTGTRNDAHNDVLHTSAPATPSSPLPLHGI